MNKPVNRSEVDAADSIGAFDAKTHLSRLLDRVESGETIVITRHGKAIAELRPISGDDERQARAIAAMKRIRERAARLKLGPFNWAEWKAYRDEGRK